MKDYSGFMPHGYCLRWDPALVNTMILSNLGIAVAYFAIPLALWYFVRQRKDLPHPWIFKLFGMFIIACGLTHIMKVWTLFKPIYWLEAAADTYTAGISLLTAAVLWPLIPKALALKSPHKLEEANEKLTKAEHNFRGLLESAPDAIVIIDQQGKIHLVNWQAEKIFGYKREELLGQPIEVVIPKEIQSIYPEDVTHLFLPHADMEPAATNLELYARHKNGAKFPVEISFNPLQTEEGFFMSSALRDISKRKQTEEALHESEERFRLIISGIKDYAVFMLDPQGTIVTWNEGAERIKGYKAHEIIGKHFSCFYREGEKASGKPMQELDIAVKRGRYEEEGLRIRKNGSHFWANVLITPLYNHSGQLTGFVKVTRDITERQQAMGVLQEQSELLDLANDAIMVRHLDGTILYWNRGAQKMYGFTEEEAIGRKSHELLNTEHPQPLNKIERDILSKGRWDGELVHYAHDGRRLIIESRQALKTDRLGKPIAILEINTDITERKEAEEKRRALAEMERINAELEQFASVASHDLQEPLRAVAGCLQILEKTHRDKLDGNAVELIHHAVDGAQRMRTLINDLLSLSRVNSEEITFLPTDMSEVLDQVEKTLEMTIQETGAVITHNRLPTLSVDKTQLTQLFQNLISNAIKFRDEKPPRVHIAAKRKGGEWLFSVRDNGIGFEQKYADKIFEPFKRLHGRDKYAGTGIGLPICKRIIERHGGKIWVKSQVNKGTTFYFTIADRGGA